MKYLIAPLVAALALGTSGFMRSLESATESSLALAQLSEEAPRTTREAAQEVGALPQAAELTEQQADALGALADALEGSARRVKELEAGLGRQIASLGTLGQGLDEVGPLISCIDGRIRKLVRASAPVPASLRGVTTELQDLIAAQNRSIRHLRSLNRKLAALGIVATVTGVSVPPPPTDAGSVEPNPPPAGRAC